MSKLKDISIEIIQKKKEEEEERETQPQKPMRQAH